MKYLFNYYDENNLLTLLGINEELSNKNKIIDNIIIIDLFKAEYDSFLNKEIKKFLKIIKYTLIQICSIYMLNNKFYIIFFGKNEQNKSGYYIICKDILTNNFEIIPNVQMYFNYILNSKIEDNQIYVSNKSFMRKSKKDDFILNSYELKQDYKQDFRIKTFKPIYNTDDYLLTICDHEGNNNIHFLYKDYNVYEIETDDNYIDLSLDILTYKMFGIYAENYNMNKNIIFKILEKNDYFNRIE